MGRAAGGEALSVGIVVYGLGRAKWLLLSGACCTLRAVDAVFVCTRIARYCHQGWFQVKLNGFAALFCRDA